ncbi:hypothetical protein Pmani_025992 [Petrolisthes manimaculis]|uniref:Uncharacterized protein n=1 Tax=Petrolisthes manimaculis TaxID=1843537 RepID=A0AAE1U0K1_9EUCA|nr:hypothetical protein Pmani_025992 [Petrolisthes manimaculis]
MLRPEGHQASVMIFLHLTTNTTTTNQHQPLRSPGTLFITSNLHQSIPPMHRFFLLVFSPPQQQQLAGHPPPPRSLMCREQNTFSRYLLPLQIRSVKRAAEFFVNFNTEHEGT